MRNLQKTKKRGGATEVFICQKGRTDTSKCIQDFSKALNFHFDDVAPDGNCFFHTLELYYTKKGNIGEDKKQNELRARIIQYILDNWSEFALFGIDQVDILELMADNAWDNNAGDLVPPAAALALNIHIILYDLKPATRATRISPAEPKRIVRYNFPEHLATVPVETVNILRINNGHFGLLTPTTSTAPTAHLAPRRRRPVIAPNTSEKPNIIANTANQLAQMKVGNKTKILETRAKRKTVAQRNNITKKRENVESNSGTNTSFKKNIERAIRISEADALKKIKKEAAIAKIAAKKAELIAKKAEKNEMRALQAAIEESLKI
jgi:hypothetical protein